MEVCSHTAAEKMAENLRLAIARVYRTGSSKGITHRKHAMLWLFQVFALTAGLYGCQVWATFVTDIWYDSSVTTRAHVLHLGLLKKLLGVKKGTHTHCVLRESGQMPIFFYWFRCTIRFWNSLLFSNNPLLEEIVRADLLLANISDTWTYQVLHALQDLPTSQQLLDAIRSRQTINLGQFGLTLREHIIGGWKDLDILTPHEAHHSSRIMRTYHTHFGVPLGNTPGWWDDRKESKSLCCLSTFAWTIPATSAAHFLAFAFLATTFWSKECVLTGIEGLMSSGSVTDVTGTLFRMRNTFCWTVRMIIWSDFAHSNSLSSHLSLRMAQLVWGPLWTNLIFLVLPLL